RNVEQLILDQRKRRDLQSNANQPTRQGGEQPAAEYVAYRCGPNEHGIGVALHLPPEIQLPPQVSHSVAGLGKDLVRTTSDMLVPLCEPWPMLSAHPASRVLVLVHASLLEPLTPRSNPADDVSEGESPQKARAGSRPDE